MFANGPGDLGSIPGRVIPKTLKMVLDTSLLNTQQYKVRINGKMKQSGERVAPSPTPRCSSYWKGSLQSPTLLYIYTHFQLQNFNAVKFNNTYHFWLYNVLLEMIKSWHLWFRRKLIFYKTMQYLGLFNAS